MSYKVTIDGEIVLQECIESILFEVDPSPDGFSTWRTHTIDSMKIKGKVGTHENTTGICDWAQITAIDPKCFKKLEVEHIKANQLIREISFSKAFVISYSENYNDDTGVGHFELYVRQQVSVDVECTNTDRAKAISASKVEDAIKPTMTVISYGNANAGVSNVTDGILDRAARGLRQSALREITADEATFIKNEFAEIGGDPNKLSFNTGRGTSYVDRTDMINVRGDIFPVDGEFHPRSIMSERAVLAHEYYGHGAYRGTTVKPGAWNDEFRASYMAAKNAPNLSEMDRIHLIQDAMARAQEAGVPIKMNNFMREILYGY